MQNTIQILMPMAGLGSRFAKAGFTTPKPLIEVDGMPMFLKAMSSLQSVDVPMKLICIIRQEHVDEWNLKERIEQALPSATVVVIPEMTRGAAETAYLAKEVIDPNQPLIIMDCDLYFQSPGYEEYIKTLLKDGDHPSFDGFLVSFDSTDPRYSYAELNEQGFVVRTAEKDPISNNALAGAYGFAKGGTFVEMTSRLLALPVSEDGAEGTVKKEYYISYLFNFMLQQGMKVKLAKVTNFDSFGTPEELEAYRIRTQ